MRLKAALLAATLLTNPAAAQQAGKLSQMPFTSVPLNGTELIYIVQNGISTKCTVAQCGQYFGTQLTITDGTHTVTSVNHILFNGAVVGGTTPNGTVTITTSAPLTITDNTHTVANVARITFTGATVGGASPNGTLLINPQALIVGTTVVSGATNGFLLYNNAGVLGAEAAPASGIAVTDGSTTVSGVTTLTLAGMIVSGTTPSATATPQWATNANVWSGTAHKFIDPAVASSAIAPTTFTEAGGTFSPDFSLAINVGMTLVHADCPCTIANPTNGYAGLSGNISITQSSTGSDTIGTWGSDYKFPSGTPPTLSTAANAVDVLPFYCSASNFCVVTFIGNLE